MTIAEHDISATLHELFDEFHMSTEEQEAFLGAEINCASSAIRSTGLTHNTTSPADIRGKVTKIPASFAGKLTSGKQQLIRKLYPDFEVTFKQEKVQAHAAAACMRMLDRMLLKKRAPSGQRLISVGGNYEYELLTSSTVVHCCTPDHQLVNDGKEAAREVQRMARLRAMAAGKGCTPEVSSRVATFLSTEESNWRCKKLTQHCTYQAGVIMMAHVYDMTLEQIAEAMISHNAQLVLGCVLYSNDMLVTADGRLPCVDGYYRIRNGRITYGFENESQWEYSHNWAELRRYGFGGAVIQVGARRAFYSITEQRGDTLFFTMTLAPVPAVVRPVEKRWRNFDGKRAIVHGYKLSDVDRTSEQRALCPESFSYPYDVFVRCLAYAVERMEKKSFSLEDLQRKVRAVTADTTINSVVISGRDKLDDEQMAYFLSNVGIIAALSVNKVISDETVLIDGVKITRSCLQQTVPAKLRMAISKVISQPFANDSAVHRFTRAVVKAFSSAEDRILAKISWETDYGYRSAVVGQGFPWWSRSTSGPSTDDFTKDDMTADELIALLAAAAEDSIEFAIKLAEAAASTKVDPRLEQWLANLRAKYKVFVDEQARRAEKQARERAEDPDTMEEPGPSTTAFEGERASESVKEDLQSETTTPAEIDPLLQARRLGVQLDPTDELSYDKHTVSEYEDVANAAIREAVALIEVAEEKLLGECITNYGQVCVGGMPVPDRLRNHGKLNFDPDMWQVVNGVIESESFLGKKADRFTQNFPYAAVFDPESRSIVRVNTILKKKVAPAEWAHMAVRVDGTPVNGIVMTTSQLVIYNGPVLLSNMRNAVKSPIPSGFSLSFVEGVPGCGKTHYIIHSVKNGDVVVACGRENADTTRERVVQHFEERRDAEAFDHPTRHIRTLDSALMRPSVVTKKCTMFLDECFQDHAGKFWALIKLWRPVAVQALGDRCQIPYIDRNYTNMCIMPRLSHWGLRVGKYVTRRCPKDATMAISQFYGYKIRTLNPVTTSLQFQFGALPNEALPDWKYLTMYQDDKQYLLRRGFPAVNTVGEVQGQTYDKVALVRVQEREMPLFNDNEQVDVALSRHTKQFVYIAPDERLDLVTKLIKGAKKNLALVDRFGDISTAGKSIYDV